ncbi:T9SS type A sorting domain-containing protein [Ignavibacterium album]|uniref:T9SS type A sorting domain-containing protein n=1 Tax=Ignavibacterium album TaxID=591197 RepID=UPI0035BABC66
MRNYMELSKVKFFISYFLFSITCIYAQTDPMLYQRWNIMDINKVRTQFNNTGLLCDGNQQNIPLAKPPAFEYPNGSGLSYGTSISVVIGAPGLQDTGAVGGENPTFLEYLDGTMDEGSAAFWDEEHFAPYPEIVGSSNATLSTDHNTWPQPWPSTIPGTNQPLIVGPEGWPGIGEGGSIIADQETYSVMYAWKGTDVGNTGRRWLKTNMEMRGFAWTGQLYQDFIIWMYVIRNIGSAPIVDMRVGIHSDFGYLPIFMPPNPWGDDDRHYYDPVLQFAYGSDDDFYEPNPTGGSLGEGLIAWSGTLALRMPGPTKKVQTYDAFHFWMEATTPRGNGASKELYFRYNLSNSGDPHDSNNDGIDDDFNENGIPDDQEGGPGYYLGLGADGLQVLGSGPFTLNPGESDTLIFATVFGMSKNQLYKNARNALVLYNSGFKPVKAPEPPKVEVVPSDGKNILYWSLDSESDPEFEGYKIYRSADNGLSWGSQTFNDFEGGIHFVPLVQADKVDGIKGNYRTLPEFAWFYLGDDTGLPPIKVIDNDSLLFFKRGDTVRVFVDDNVINGLNYRYYIAAYDSGNGITGPLENTPATKPQNGTNTVQAVPHAPVSYGSLSQVKVVPNPYIVANGWEQGDERQIQFTHLPLKATIRILNSAGDLVKTIYHEQSNSIAPSIAKWDLKNENQQLVAPGLYFFHVESAEGSASGKFIIIL